MYTMYYVYCINIVEIGGNSPLGAWIWLRNASPRAL